ncbi:hypothetical protein [Clostridium vincentii]|uniref:Uncharacterized protein n=1 Tax=Clostridium vincentii TaxID=52704 RepID=A0A2T0BD22_9CLOT|nr:hypothetical protein [Clostridium vincentii]PRR81745.1 hypothetical protein CLVI_22340 [Clostridium vincentii]
MLLNEKSKYNDKEIIEKGSSVLIKELGYSGFIRFIRQVENNGSEDYLSIQQEIYKDMNIDEIYKQAKDN